MVIMAITRPILTHMDINGSAIHSLGDGNRVPLSLAIRLTAPSNKAYAAVAIMAVTAAINTPRK